MESDIETLYQQFIEDVDRGTLAERAERVLRGKASQGSAMSIFANFPGGLVGFTLRKLLIDSTVSCCPSDLEQLADRLVEFYLDALELESYRTADLAAQLGGLGIDGRTLLIDAIGNENLILAARNNPKLKTVDALGVNVYDVVDRPFVVASESALSRLIEVLSS